MAMSAAAAALGACAFLGRLRYRQSLTCHFCNRYAKSRLSSALPGSWYCPFDDCGQYNGFTSDGDYDRTLPELSDPAYNFQFSHCSRGPFLTNPLVLCSQCQCEQGLKIRALARAESAAEASAIERRYKLCSSCQSAVSNRLKTVNRRIQCSYTPLAISETVQETFVSVFPKILLLCFLVELVLIWQSLVPLFAMLHIPVAIPFSSIPFMASVSSHEYLLAVFKLFMIRAASRRTISYIVLAVFDVVLTLYLHGFLANFAFIPLPAFGCLPSDPNCTYRVWTVIIRCLGIAYVAGCLIKSWFNNRPVSLVRKNTRQPGPFDAHFPGSIHKNEQGSKPQKQPVLFESGFQFSQDKLRNDLFAIEGARSCPVEDLFAGISISRSHNIFASPEAVKDDQASPSDSTLFTSVVFAVSIVCFILNIRLSHWSISYLYTISLMVLLVVGRRRPITLPFTIMLLFRQYRSFFGIGPLVFEFLAKFGFDIAGLLLIGLVFFVDWSALIARASSCLNSQASLQEA